MTERSARLLDMFRGEARECLAALTGGALQIERGDAPPELVGALFRSAHTLKGGARMLGLDEVARLADGVEASLVVHRGAGGAPPVALGAELLGGVEALRRAIWPEDAGPSAATSAEGVEAPPRQLETTVRVKADRVGALVDLVAEARRLAGRTAGPDAPAEARSLVELLGSAEEAALRLRLVPLGGMFDDLRLAVREAGASDGKQAELRARGGEVEADAAVVDVAAEVILQLVRNAVAHGIEPHDERVRAGKQPVGLVEVAVRAAGGWLELRVSDDGRGVDVEAVRERARRLGLDDGIPPEELLFAAGLSTRRSADQLGGQGVGMDVVRARTRAAGGDATVSWRSGAGTEVVVRLPVAALYERLVVAELDGTLVGVPVDAIAEVLSNDDSTLSAVGLAVEGRPGDVSVLTVPLGPLLAPSRLVRRAWIAPDGRVGLVLETAALAS
jgi:two-component system chemotaxis sensor kinase CheA